MTFTKNRIILFVKKSFSEVLIIFLLTFLFKTYAQNDHGFRKIKIEKPDGNLYFYQLGTISDTISSGDHDLFYLVATGLKTCDLKIEIENGMFKTTKNDSIYQLVRMPGMKYIHVFSDTSSYIRDKKEIAPCPTFMSYVNGISVLENPHFIFITIISRKGKDAILENVYYVR